MRDKISFVKNSFLLLVIVFGIAGCAKMPESLDTALSEQSPPPTIEEHKDDSITEIILPLAESASEKKREDTAEPEEGELSLKEKHWKRIFEKAFAPVYCPPPPQRNLPSTSYQGPMIDAHIHIHSLPDGAPGFPDDYYTGNNLGIEYSIAEWVCMMDYEGTSRSLAFFPVWEPITQQSLDLVKGVIEKYPGRFIPFIMPPDNDGSTAGSSTVDARALEAMLKVYPGLFQGYGEIGLYGHISGAPALPPDSPRLMEIYPVIRKHNLLVYFHLGEGQKEAFERVLDKNPDITFIWHGDQLIQCASCKQNLDDVEEILTNHPNVYYGVDELYGDVFLLNEDHTQEEFIYHFQDYGPLLEKDLRTWKRFIERHPDQVLWDTDRGVGSPWSIDTEVALTLNNYSRAFIGRLDPAVQEKFAYKNADKLITGNFLTEKIRPADKGQEIRPVLKNLGISIQPWEKTTNKAGDFVFENKNYADSKIFTEFAHKIVNDFGEKLLPEIGFNVPVGTTVVSPIDGIISDVKFYEPSQDYILSLKTSEGSPWIVGFEHVYHVQVKAGDKVLVNQELAEVSPSYGRMEFGNVEINVWTGGKEIIKYCPFEFLDESLKPTYTEKINQLAEDWEEFIGKDVYDQEKWVAPGCLLYNLTER